MNKIVRILCAILLLQYAVACRAESFDEPLLDIAEQSQPKERTEINILIVGNSYSRDAFGYLPGILGSLFREMNLNIYNLQIGGVALNNHLKALKENKAAFDMDYYMSLNDKWLTVKRYQTTKKFFDRRWDLVILQQGSGRCLKYEETLADIKGLRNYLDGVTSYKYLTYMINPPQPEGNASLNGETMDQRFETIAAVAKRLLDEGIVSHLIPCGTALQNARQTYLDSIGDFGHMSYEGRHLQDGLPCVIEGYAGAQMIMNILDLPGKIEDSNWRVSQLWVDVKRIPGKHGQVIEGTEEDYVLCQRCARAAIEKPLALTRIETNEQYPDSEVYNFVHEIVMKYIKLIIDN